MTMIILHIFVVLVLSFTALSNSSPDTPSTPTVLDNSATPTVLDNSAVPTVLDNSALPTVLDMPPPQNPKKRTNAVVDSTPLQPNKRNSILPFHEQTLFSPLSPSPGLPKGMRRGYRQPETTLLPELERTPDALEKWVRESSTSESTIKSVFKELSIKIAEKLHMLDPSLVSSWLSYYLHNFHTLDQQFIEIVEDSVKMNMQRVVDTPHLVTVWGANPGDIPLRNVIWSFDYILSLNSYSKRIKLKFNEIEELRRNIKELRKKANKNAKLGIRFLGDTNASKKCFSLLVESSQTFDGLFELYAHKSDQIPLESMQMQDLQQKADEMARSAAKCMNLLRLATAPRTVAKRSICSKLTKEMNKKIFTLFKMLSDLLRFNEHSFNSVDLIQSPSLDMINGIFASFIRMHVIFGDYSELLSESESS